MKKFYFVTLAILFLNLQAKNEVRIIHSDANSITLEYQFVGLAQQNVTIDGKNFLQINSPGCVPVLNQGFPQVLRDAVSLAVPSKSLYKIDILSAQYTTINDVQLIPSKGSLKRNVNPADVPYTFGTAYQKNEWYPKGAVEITTDYMYRGQNGVALSIYPVQVNPVTKSMKVMQSIIVKVSFLNKKLQPLSLNLPEYNSNEEKMLLEKRFLNLANPSTASKAQYTPINEFGDMLIISHPPFIPQMNSLADWKNQKGIKTHIVSSAVTGTTGPALQTYIQNYYNTHPNLLYVLLVGDHQQLRAFNAGTAGSETKWSDTYYSFVSGNDHYPDLMIGRFSSGDSLDIATMIERTLEYEKTPMPGTFYNKALGIGSNEGEGIGDEGEADWQHLRNIGNKLTDTISPTANYSYFHEFYDGSKGGNDASGNPTSAMVSAAVNDGVSLFMYTGHGSQNSCATSNFSSSNINTCTNNGKYPFSVQVACNNGTFISGTCFCEAFLRARNVNGPTGAIASAGSSILMAWAEPMDTQDEIGDILSNQYTNNLKYTIGGLFYNGQMHMLDMYPTATGEEVMETWVMFGDPSVTMRTQDPSTITVSHFHCIKDVDNNFTLLTNAGPNAYATLRQNNLTIGEALLTGTSTTIAFTNTFIVTQPIELTITEFNKFPHIETIPVCITTGLNDWDLLSQILVVNPIQNNRVEILHANPGSVYALQLTSMEGKVLESKSNLQTTSDGTLQLSLTELPKGIYLLQVTENGLQSKTFKLIK